MSIWASPLTGEQEEISGLEFGRNPAFLVRGKVLNCINPKLSKMEPTKCGLIMGGKSLNIEVFIANDGFRDCSIIWGNENVDCQLYYGSDSGNIVIQAPDLNLSPQLAEELSRKDPITIIGYQVAGTIAFSLLGFALILMVYQSLQFTTSIKYPELITLIVAIVIMAVVTYCAHIWAILFSNRLVD